MGVIRKGNHHMFNKTEKREIYLSVLVKLTLNIGELVVLMATFLVFGPPLGSGLLLTCPMLRQLKKRGLQFCPCEWLVV